MSKSTRDTMLGVLMITLVLAVTSPSKKNFSEFISSNLINKADSKSLPYKKELESLPFLKEMAIGLSGWMLGSFIKEDDYIIFKIFTIDASLVPGVGVVRYIGIAGQFFQLDGGYDLVRDNESQNKFENENDKKNLANQDQGIASLYQNVLSKLNRTQFDYYYPELIKYKDKFYLSKNGNKTEIDEFLNALNEFKISEPLYEFNGFTVGKNMMPHSGGYYLTFFINHNSGQIYYLIHMDCLKNEVCSNIEAYGADKESIGEYTMPKIIRDWISKELSTDAESNMVFR